MGERHVRNVEAAGSTPVPSTNKKTKGPDVTSGPSFLMPNKIARAYTPLSFLQREYT